MFLLFFAAALAVDPSIEPLRATLSRMRSQWQPGTAARGATGNLTVAKHQLRDWAESQVKTLPAQGGEEELALRLNAELSQAALICDHKADQCLGFVEELRIMRPPGTNDLVLVTSMNIDCGIDESAYLYRWSATRKWQRIWQNEQTVYTEAGYKPQALVDVVLRGNLVLTTGHFTWCASNWQPVYYRLFKIGSPAPILYREEFAYLGSDFPIRGKLSDKKAMVEFYLLSVDAAVHSRLVFRHFEIDQMGMKAIRVPPFAADPRDFVDEWMTLKWEQVSAWTEPAERLALQALHQTLHKDFVSVDFGRRMFQCGENLYQVRVDPNEEGKKSGRIYFQVRWVKPYGLTLVGAGPGPFPGCTIPIPEPQ